MTDQLAVKLTPELRKFAELGRRFDQAQRELALEARRARAAGREAEARELFARVDRRSFEERLAHLRSGVDDRRFFEIQQRHPPADVPLPGETVPWYLDLRTLELERDERTPEERRLCLAQGTTDDSYRRLRLKRYEVGSQLNAGSEPRDVLALVRAAQAPSSTLAEARLGAAERSLIKMKTDNAELEVHRLLGRFSYAMRRRIQSSPLGEQLIELASAGPKIELTVRDSGGRARRLQAAAAVVEVVDQELRRLGVAGAFEERPQQSANDRARAWW